MTPEEIVRELDKYIIGQHKAKRAVAIALRNRWRIQQVPEPLRQEITPKNILMIGPTGVGKTEIARRLARLANAPFIKVEATKFTEVGYVGRDVDTIVRDLIDISIKMTRDKALKEVEKDALRRAEERILDILLPPPMTPKLDTPFSRLNDEKKEESDTENKGLTRKPSLTREKFRKQLLAGELNDKMIEIEITEPSAHVELLGPPGMENVTSHIESMFESFSGKNTEKKRMRIAEAMPLLVKEESAELIRDEEICAEAIRNAENNGIVFIDEIDKIASRGESQSSDVSPRQGVQRDLLPLVEGTTVKTRYGMVKTDHILFIGSGAFHYARPSDLIPELQGRFPIRVHLDSLSVDDFEKILTATDASLTRQYQALLLTEQVTLEFDQESIHRLATIAYAVNERNENIGARRLYTVMEKLLEDISFNAKQLVGQTIKIDTKMVQERLADLAQSEDLSRYVL